MTFSVQAKSTIRSLVVNYRVSLKSSSMSHFEGKCFRLCFPLVSKKRLQYSIGEKFFSQYYRLPTYTFLLIYYLCNVINHLLGNLLAIHSYLPLFHVVPCRDFSPPSLYQTSVNIYVAVQRQAHALLGTVQHLHKSTKFREGFLCEKLHYIIL